MSESARHASSPAESDEQFAGSDEPTDRFPAVRSVHVPQQRRGSARLHRARPVELAALAFGTPLPIPAQRGPVRAEMRPAV